MPVQLDEALIFTAPAGKLEMIKNKQQGFKVAGTRMKPADAPSVTSWLTSQKNPKIIAVYNFKGGVGKTTLTVNTAGALAEHGKRVLMVDADAQTNLTSYFMPPPSGGDNDDDDQLDPIQPGGPAVFDQVDRIKPKSERTAPDYRILKNSVFAHNSIDDIDQALAGPFRESDAQLEPPAKYFKPLNSIFGDRLLLLPGSPYLYDLDGTLTKSKGDTNEIMMHTAFGNLLRMAAYVTDADYVLVDMGPSSSYLNKVLLMSCDYVLPPMFPDFFSLSSLHALLHVMLPSTVSELSYLKTKRDKAYEQPENATVSKIKAFGYTYTDKLGPAILPFIVTNYRKKGAAADGTPGSTALGQGDPDEDSFGPEWVTTGPGKFIASMRDLIKAFRTEQGAVQDQEVIKSLLKPDADGQMVIPLLRAMPKLMAESQETGVPVVAMTRDWWLNTIKPQLQDEGLVGEFPSKPELHQLVGDHVYTKARMKMLVTFLESL